LQKGQPELASPGLPIRPASSGLTGFNRLPSSTLFIRMTLTGLRAQHYSYVKNISVGLPLFLFNYSDRKLHGIFEAAGHGQMNIHPYAWTTDGSERILFPAQVL